MGSVKPSAILIRKLIFLEITYLMCFLTERPVYILWNKEKIKYQPRNAQVWEFYGVTLPLASFCRQIFCTISFNLSLWSCFCSLPYKQNPVLLPGSTHSSFSRKISFWCSRKTPFPLLYPSNLHPTFLQTLLVLLHVLFQKTLERCWGLIFYSLTSPSFFHP